MGVGDNPLGFSTNSISCVDKRHRKIDSHQAVGIFNLTIRCFVKKYNLDTVGKTTVSVSFGVAFDFSAGSFVL